MIHTRLSEKIPLSVFHDALPRRTDAAYTEFTKQVKFPKTDTVFQIRSHLLSTRFFSGRWDFDATDLQRIEALDPGTWHAFIGTLDRFYRDDRRHIILPILKSCLEQQRLYDFAPILERYPWNDSSRKIHSIIQGIVSKQASLAPNFIENTKKYRFAERDMHSVVGLTSTYPALLRLVAERNLFPDFFKYTDLFFKLQNQTHDLSVEVFLYLKKTGALDDYPRLQKTQSKLKEAFWGIAYQLGSDIFSLTRDERAFAKKSNNWAPAGVATAFAFIPRKYWTTPLFEKLCLRYGEGAGYEYLYRGEQVFRDLDDPKQTAFESWLKDHLGIQYVHRYLRDSPDKDTQWALLRTVKENFERRSTGDSGSKRRIFLSLFPGLDRVTPVLYANYVASLMDLSKEVDVLISEIDSRPSIARRRNSFAKAKITDVDFLTAHFHGGAERIYLNDYSLPWIDGGHLTMDHQGSLKKLFTWVKPGGTAALEVCDGAHNFPLEESIFGKCVKAAPNRTFIGFRGEANIFSMKLVKGELAIECSHPGEVVYARS